MPPLASLVFPFDKVTIDRSLALYVGKNIKQKASVRAITPFGDALGIQIMDEGVENTEQFESGKMPALRCRDFLRCAGRGPETSRNHPATAHAVFVKERLRMLTPAGNPTAGRGFTTGTVFFPRLQQGAAITRSKLARPARQAAAR